MATHAPRQLLRLETGRAGEDGRRENHGACLRYIRGHIKITGAYRPTWRPDASPRIRRITVRRPLFAEMTGGRFARKPPPTYGEATRGGKTPYAPFDAAAAAFCRSAQVDIATTPFRQSPLTLIPTGLHTRRRTDASPPVLSARQTVAAGPARRIETTDVSQPSRHYFTPPGLW